MRGLVRYPITYPVSEIKEEDNNVASSVSEHLEEQRIWLWQQFAQKVTPAVQQIVEFAKRVPGFCDFAQDDQLILIKLGFFELWLSHIAKAVTLTNNNNGTTTITHATDASLTFDDGTCLTRHQLETMYDVDYVNDLLNFVATYNRCGLSDTEVGLFTALALMAADRPGITEPKAIIRARDRISEALRVQILRTRPNSTNALQIMPELEAKIPELRGLGARHVSHLDWIRTNWPLQSILRLPPLFNEIFDIPKTEDDL